MINLISITVYWAIFFPQIYFFVPLIVCLIISFHSMLVTNGAYSKIELSVVELPCNYVSKAKIDRYTVYDYYSLRIWLLCKSLDDKDQIDGIWYDSTFFFFLVLYFSMLRYFPACQWPGRHHQRLPVQVAQGQEVEKVLVRDEGQGPLHIQGFRGKEGGIYRIQYYTGFINNIKHRIIACSIIKGIWSFLKKIFACSWLLCSTTVIGYIKKSPGWDML